MSDIDRCEEVNQKLPSYVLGALESEELSLVENHLAHCERSRQLLREYQAVMEGMMRIPDPIDPSSGLRLELEKTIQMEPRSRFSKFASADRTWPRLAVGLAFALLVGINLILFSRLQVLEQSQIELQAAMDRSRSAMSVVSNPQAQTTRVEGEGFRAAIIYDPSRAEAVLYAWGLEPLEPDETYQAWLIQPDGTPVDVGLFDVAQGAPFVWLLIVPDQNLQNFEAFGVSIEPAEGSPAPSDRILFATEL